MRWIQGVALFFLLASGLSSAFQERALRLAGGNRIDQGRVEIYHEGEWGTVCDDGWDMNEATVVCKALGFSKALSAEAGQRFPPGSGPIMLDDLNCFGNESSLAECPRKGWKDTDCHHIEDAGVVCSSNEDDGDLTVHTFDKSCEISEVMGDLFDSQKDCDLFISVRTEERPLVSQEICGHRAILTLNPEAYFLLKEGNNFTLNIQDGCVVQAMLFIRYFYTHKIKVMLSSLRCIHHLASTYKVNSLKEYTARFFSVLMSEDPSFKRQMEIFNYAESSSDSILQDLCLRYFAWNFESFSQSSAWNDLQFGQLLSLISRSDVVAESERVLLAKLQNWLSDHPVEVEGDLLIERIRLPMMNVEELLLLHVNKHMHEKDQYGCKDNITQALLFHTVPYQTLKKYMNLLTDAFTPRIYTSTTWRSSEYTKQDLFQSDQNVTSPQHTSLLFTSKMVNWTFAYIPDQQTCQDYGLTCSSDSLPAFSLTKNATTTNVGYQNTLVMKCGGSVIGIQQFRKEMAVDPAAARGNSFPCSSKDNKYMVVIRPMYSAE